MEPPIDSLMAKTKSFCEQVDTAMMKNRLGKKQDDSVLTPEQRSGLYVRA